MRKKTLNEFKLEAKKVHNDKYDYSLVIYNGVGSKIDIICPIHGAFKKICRDHLNGQGCPKCSKNLKYTKFKISANDLVKRFKEKHNDRYDYSLVKYENLKTQVKIICPEHGVFLQRPDVHLKGMGCKQCYLKDRGLNSRLTTADFIAKSKKIHGDKYEYSNTNYTTNIDYVEIICKKHGVFSQMAQAHLHGSGCPKCSFVITKPIVEICELLKENNIHFEINDRKILNGKELDIFIPSHNLAIEYNGLYWHSEIFVNKDYHLKKTNECKEKDVQLIHIFEDEWVLKKDIVKSRIKNLLGLSENKIYARQCIIKNVSNNDAKSFLNENHIQGNVNSKIKLGLYYNDNLVSLITFGSLRKNLGAKSINNTYELIRFCNKLNTNVVGGASKLLKFFIKNYAPDEIISYADKRWSQGSLYEKIGFQFEIDTKANYFYIIKNKRVNRFSYRKDLLVAQGFDMTKTEHEIMLERGIYRIYDTGHKKYKMIINQL